MPKTGDTPMYEDSDDLEAVLRAYYRGEEETPELEDEIDTDYCCETHLSEGRLWVNPCENQ